MKSRMTLLMVGCILFAGALVGRALMIQVIGDSRLQRLANRQFNSKVLMRPRRGMILDRNGEPLAVNIEINSLAANPGKVKNKPALARTLSKALGIPYSTVIEKLTEKREFVWIRRHLAEAQMQQLRRFRVIDSDGDLSEGMWLVKEGKRAYPHGSLAGHLLGSVNIDIEGVEGVELWMNDRLRGKVASVSAIRDALGRPTFIDTTAAKDLKEGEPVQLTIDASLQFSVEDELRNAVKKTGSTGGTVIVMNAVSGEILAMANEPFYNPNLKGAATSSRRNRAVTDGYEPGSTMKAVLLASALSNGFHLHDRLWGEKGNLVVQGKRISEAESHEKFEWLSLRKMLQVSSNVVAAKLALKLGADRYQGSVRTFGFGEKSGMGFPGEISGLVPARKGWTPLTTANIGFGQGVLVTPIQMTRAYAAFLNGGWLVQPTLIKVDQEKAVQPPKRILLSRTADDVVAALEGVVSGEDGTGKKARLDGYRVAGKTGTSQMVDSETGRYSRSRYVGSFIGFATGVEPKLVIFTALQEPKGIYYGGETAAPLFHAVLQAAANRFSMPPAPSLAAQSTQKAIADQVQTSQAAPVRAALEWEGMEENGRVQWKMPSLIGLTPREALRVLKGYTFAVEVHGAAGVGLVKSQFPAEGKIVSDGGTVKLVLGD